MKIYKFLGAFAINATLCGCAQQDVEKLNHELNSLTLALSGNSVGSTITTTANYEPIQIEPAQLNIPTDKKAGEAVSAAMPNIRKVLTIHRCVQESGLAKLNFLAVPGNNINRLGAYGPNSQYAMTYHDRSACPTIRVIDKWTMPALNALRFRVVYIAEDSGETVSFAYLFMKQIDGSWLLAETEPKAGRWD